MKSEDSVKSYLDAIGRYPLLTQEDEVRLARLIEQGRKAGEALAEGVTEERTRLRRQVRDGKKAFEQFVNANLRLVVSVAKRYQGSDLPLIDLVQEGNIGLIRAVEKFDWRRGFKFSTYATWWIRQAIGRAIDNTGRAVRLPVHTCNQLRRVQRTRASMEAHFGRPPTIGELAAEVGMGVKDVERHLSWVAEPVSLATPIGPEGDGELADTIADDSGSSPFDEVAAALLGSELQRLLSPLPERERRILSLRFGLDRGEPRTLDEVGAEMHLTRERIRQIERSALSRLSRPTTEALARELLAS